MASPYGLYMNQRTPMYGGMMSWVAEPAEAVAPVSSWSWAPEPTV